MLFEVLVLLMTSLNALDKPRSAQVPLRRTLHRDGIGYFLVSENVCQMMRVLTMVSAGHLNFEDLQHHYCGSTTTVLHALGSLVSPVFCFTLHVTC